MRLKRAIERDLRPYESMLREVERLGEPLHRLSDDSLRDEAGKLRGESPDGAVVVRAFALAREAAERVLRMRPYDVQLLAGLAIYRGRIVEMQTGEGKTLAAVAPAFAHALSGRGAHVLTFNDYLARRDAEWMGPLYEFLGLEVDYVQQAMDPARRRDAYAADVTYVTAKEAGFDFLRDAIVEQAAHRVQRPYHFALVDEADSLLIDEARVPLVLAGAAASAHDELHGMAELARRLVRGRDFTVDDNGRNIALTDEGLDAAQRRLDCGELVDPGNLQRFTQLHCALHAEVLLKRDVDYIVRDDEVLLVDDFTGRVVADRHWPDGLQAALEAKEGVARRPDGRILESITLQNLLKQYPSMAGMTGTAVDAADEFREFYGVRTVVIPTHRVSIREDHPDVVFQTKGAKQAALLDEIREVHATGRPLLVGTASVGESETLASALRDSGVDCRVLNAMRDADEARIVAEAGALAAVTISTNMAGRGTDIRLGGANEQQREAVVALGGLYVIGTHRHESPRIDRQLRGRAGRQGDPGCSRFFVSLEDDLLVRFGIDRRLSADSPAVRREIDYLQRVVAGQNFDIRRTLDLYSGQVEEQRRIMQRKRRMILDEAQLPSPLRREDPERHLELSALAGHRELARAERRIALHHHDRLWSEHLDAIQEMRDGIHLERIGGRDPLQEYGCRVAARFMELEGRIDEEVVRTLRQVQVGQNGIDLDAEGIRGPSSTWTYLVNDDPFRDQLGLQLMGMSSWGAAAGAAMFTTAGPLIIGWGLYNRFFRRQIPSREVPDETPNHLPVADRAARGRIASRDGR